MTFDPELVMGHLWHQTLVLLTKFGQNRVKHVTTRAHLEVDRRKKKKEERRKKKPDKNRAFDKTCQMQLDRVVLKGEHVHLTCPYC